MFFFSKSVIRTKRPIAKIIQITDMHLLSDKKAKLLGIDTYSTFSAVMDEIEQLQLDYDLIVATGDISQDGSEAAYARIARRCAALTIPCLWLPGNHDEYKPMKAVFDRYKLHPGKIILLGEEWVIVLLNTQVKNENYGYLSTEAFAQLKYVRAQFPTRYILVFLHHHPIVSGSAWLDQHCLKNSSQLLKEIADCQRIKGIGYGHIHQNSEIQHLDCLFFATLSTCFQFKASCSTFTLENKQPGWRMISLYSDGSIMTEVQCLKTMLVTPTMTVTGY